VYYGNKEKRCVRSRVMAVACSYLCMSRRTKIGGTGLYGL